MASALWAATSSSGPALTSCLTLSGFKCSPFPPDIDKHIILALIYQLTGLPILTLIYCAYLILTLIDFRAIIMVKVEKDHPYLVPSPERREDYGCFKSAAKSGYEIC